MRHRSGIHNVACLVLVWTVATGWGTVSGAEAGKAAAQPSGKSTEQPVDAKASAPEAKAQPGKQQEQAPAQKKPEAPKPSKKPSMPTWTSRSGTKLQAEFVEYRYGRVVFRTPDGNLTQIHVSALADEDQQRVKQLHAEQQGVVRFEKEPAEPDRLPVFLSGKWKDFHAAYEGRTYEVGITAQGDLRITLKDGDEAMDVSLRVGQRHWYTEHDTKQRRHRKRPIVSFDDYETPSDDVREIEFNGMLKDGVHFTFGYEFEPKELKAYGWVDDPSDIKYRTQYRITFRMPSLHKVPKDITFAGLEEMLRGCEVEIEPKDGETITYPYHKGVQRFTSRADTMWIRGPMIAPRTITIDALSRQDAWLNPHIYRGYAPWRGYGVWLSKRDRESKSKAEAMIMTFD